MNLAKLKPGEIGRITAIASPGGLKRRLMDMGMLIGEQVQVVKLAPMGDPMEVTVKSYRLSLRRKEAERIEVEVAG